MNFNNSLACSLDNQTEEIKFRKLFVFLSEFDINSLIEWKQKRNFVKSGLEEIIQTLKSIDKLK